MEVDRVKSVAERDRGTCDRDVIGLTVVVRIFERVARQSKFDVIVLIGEAAIDRRPCRRCDIRELSGEVAQEDEAARVRRRVDTFDADIIR